MGKVNFVRESIRQEESVPAGSGSIVIDIPFVPNFIQPSVLGASTTSELPEFQYSLTTVSATEYQLTVQYNVRERTRIRIVAANLYISPEQTINF